MCESDEEGPIGSPPVDWLDARRRTCHMWCHLRALKGRRLFSDWCPLQDLYVTGLRLVWGVWVWIAALSYEEPRS